MTSRIFREDLLAGQVAVITGGGTGIGRATALEMAALGADIALVGRRPEPLRHTQDEIGQLGRTALALPCDIRDYDAVGKTVDAVLDRFGRIDTLFNNAGGQFFQPSTDLTPGGWQAVLNTNLSGTFFFTQHVANRAMIPSGGGAIVNMVINMWRGQPAAVHSAAARAGIDNLTKSLSVEWAVHKIRINAVAPGTVRTEGLDQYPEDVVRQLRSIIPLKREGTPEEIAWLVCYLASEAGAWITGETICIDGGSQNWGSMWNIPDDNSDIQGYRRDE